MLANIYIDGFNLYYGAVKNTPYKWLNVAALCQTLLPRININNIKYFTARVKSTPHDPQAPLRQNVYLRALSTIPNLTIVMGHFVSWPRLMPQFPLAYPPRGIPTSPPQKVQVQRQEEKGSDVNLATYLLIDCFENDFDEAVVVSNDSDLTLPIEKVTTQYGKIVRVVNPHKGKLSGDLVRVATSHIRSINKKVLAGCQFPSTITDLQGTFTKPSVW